MSLKNTLLLLSSANFGALDSSLQRAVYHEYYMMVYSVIMYMVKDHGIAEDIIQETFLKVVKHIPVVENEGQLKAWIKTVVRNTTYSYLKKNKKNRKEMETDIFSKNECMELSSDKEAIEVEIELKAMSEGIGTYLNELKPENRILMEMRWKQDLSYKEIAAELGCTEQTVKYKLHRAREAIKKRFLKEWGGGR
ncbi:RNA polymerase sigma-70 factor, ECF subfamily [Paenibacillus sp. UNC496MF]|uniref:RNA polymerase sigma factor n=1 Tax=Paenibacillus sp. UNC496MF TaxID=1502753 RepID=UPI0008E8F8ED|nr:sigma-70 family RNA polymerase sigma factor [Paenibacillus sp. UNC496MF]SFJ55933.1 RNA polymerase sigma-70 factor, ECF subfamily [Paenibacillus sp. UNC496MF]